MKSNIYNKILVLFCLIQCPPSNAQFTDLNLDFEIITNKNSPYNWFNNTRALFKLDSINTQSGKYAVSTYPQNEMKYAQMSLQILNKGYHQVEFSSYIQTIEKGDVKIAIYVNGKRYNSKNANIDEKFNKYTVKAPVNSSNREIILMIGADVKSTFDNLSITLDGKKYGIGLKQLPNDEILKLQSNSSTKFMDLLKSNKKFDKAKLFAFGEGTHGTKEFHEFRQNASKILIKEYGVNNILLECSYYDGLIIDNYVQNITDTLKLSEMKFWIYQNKEFETFVNWLRKYNSNQINKVHIIGIDIMNYGTSIDDLLTYSKKKNDNKLFKSLNKFRQIIFSINDIDTGKRKDSKKPINFLNKIIHKMDSTTYVDNKHEIHILKNYCNLLANSSGLTRDRAMFKNIKYFQKNNLPQIVFAHNSHVSDFKTESPLETISFLTFTYSGTYTARKQNDKLSINTLEFPQVGSLEYYLNIIFKENTILRIDSENIFLKNLISTTSTRNIGSMENNDFILEANNPVNDYFIFIPETTHSETYGLLGKY